MKISGIKRRYRIIIGIIIFIALLLFAAPRFARWYIVKKSPVLIGRKVTVGKIRLNYFTGTLRISELKLFEPDSRTVFLSFKQLQTRINFIPLFKNEISVKSFFLDDPYLQVLQNGEKFNFSSLLKSDTLTAIKDTVPAKPLIYDIKDIRINRGYLKYTDERLNNTIAMDRLDLKIPGFRWNSDSTKLGIDLRFIEGGGLNSNLAIDLPDSTYSVNLKLDSLNLSMIEPYVRSNMHISALHGYLSTDILIKGNMRSILQLFVRGTSHISDFQLIDTLKRPVLSFKDLTVDIDTLQLDKNKIKFKYIGLTDPVMFFETIDSTNNWLALLKPAPAPPDTLQKQPVKSTSNSHGAYHFSKLLITGGKVNYSDKTLRFPFEYTIDNLRIESAPFSNNEDKYSLSLSASLNNTGSFTANASIDPARPQDLDLSFSIKEFRMKDIDAYFKDYFGFSVTGGIMNFNTENKLRSTSLVGNNALYMRKFSLSDSRLKESRYHIPLRLAIGILSDKDGIIDLKAPVEMKGKDLKVRNLGKIIFKVIGDLFVKAAVSPVRMLSELFKVDPSSLQQITLGLSEPSPDEKNLKSVDVISDILNKKPELSIDFFYCIDLKKTSDTLAYMLAKDDYKKYCKSIGVDAVSIPDSTLTKYLLGKDSSSVSHPPGNILTLCHNYIGNERLKLEIDSLRSMQTNFLMTYLSRDKEIAADRFRIISPAPDSIKYSGAFPSFRTYFTASEETQK
jgi:Domain of Unknown Function (DUF748)